MRYHPAKSVIYMRNIFVIAMLFCLVVLYVIWTSSTGDLVKPISSAQIVNDSSFICNESFDDGRKFFANPEHQKDVSGRRGGRGGGVGAVSSSIDLAIGSSTLRTQQQQQQQQRHHHDSNSLIPIIYFVTPTYPRREQIAELTRLGQTLMHIPNLHWIVADDFDGCNLFLDYLLNRFGIPYTHIASPMPDIYRSYAPIPRGVANRRAAINWIRTNGKKNGVLYFGDDDNTFDLKLFAEIRQTKKVSMFPVGLIGLYAVSTPIVKQGKVIGFFDSWPAKRMWPVDMAGFAVNLEYMSHHPNATMPYKAGYEEDEFLKSIGLKIGDIEPKANNCSEILVWHTQTKKEKNALLRMDTKVLDSDHTSLGPLLRELEALGVSHISPSAGITPQVSKFGKSKPISSIL